MTVGCDALRRILRTQMTAVNQQFVHIVALRHWGETALADRIGVVDNADFPVCMKIMDLLVAERVPMALRFRPFAPGDTVNGILAAELRIEREMERCLSVEIDAHHPAAAWLADARRPRKAYVDWLVAQKVRPQDDGISSTTSTPINTMFAQLVALIEQGMAHAFVHWHHGDRKDADIAWATSGVAMMKSRLLTLALSELGVTPKAPPAAKLSICEDPVSAVEHDRQLAVTCAQAAAIAAEAAAGKVASVSRQIENFARLLAEHRTGDHPSMRLASPAFGSFSRTRDMYLRPAETV